MAAAAAKREQGLPPAPRQLSVARFLSQWLADSVKPRVRPWTYKGYEVIVRVHLTPAIGRVALAELSVQDVQAMVTKQQEQGLASKSIQYIRGVLRTALNDALRWELVHRNVAALARVPSVERKPINPLSPQEARILLAASRYDRLGTLFAVALSLGLRQGEALGLTWDRVDLANRLIHVDRQLQRVDGKLQLVSLKTTASRRSLPLPDSIALKLEGHRFDQADERRIAGSRWIETGLVFTSTVGTGLDGTAVTKRFQKFLDRAGIPPRRFHDLRHSCASLLLTQNVAPRVVMEILGHSQISMTMNTYSHVMPEQQRDAATSMDAVLRGSSDASFRSALQPSRLQRPAR